MTTKDFILDPLSAQVLRNASRIQNVRLIYVVFLFGNKWNGIVSMQLNVFCFCFSVYFATLLIVGGRLPLFTGIVVHGFI